MCDSVVRFYLSALLHQVKLIAVNDSFILESNVFQILRHHFGHEAFYPTLFDLFREVRTITHGWLVVHITSNDPWSSIPSDLHYQQVTLQTEMGQLLDLTSQPTAGEIDLERFTLERYKLIVKYKTAFYTFYLPIVSMYIHDRTVMCGRPSFFLRKY
jgi:farnesyl diphosphate synthase